MKGVIKRKTEGMTIRNLKTRTVGGRSMKVLKVKDVAEMLGTSPANVRLLTYRGRLPGRKMGGRIVFLEEELREYLKRLPKVVEVPGKF